MYVPNGVGAFGSSYKEIDDLDEGWNFFLTKTRWRYLDRPAQRCDEEVMYVIFELSSHCEAERINIICNCNSLNDLDLETTKNSTFRYPNTTSCIVEFIEDQLGCSPNIIGSNKKSPRLPCETTSQLTEMAKLSRSLDEADDTAIYEMTGDEWMENQNL